ncbi:TIGR03862 family flavoprotein [Acinetobacter bereziniae]|uniref:TIGR03862 family flavoprotein n=1 Tax=Acinetobacter bereziniae TaxID=106648 RepID=UPI00124FE59D|nr:TIGR03862 family flavoprotein [Acinetobacter bereziniae]MBJ8451177.1 TIGR03862 family flavoprotein [Acinetobacter bereziniae]MBJ8455861.1 TIGR03862 family flavoprotein [Acinetobacter bereziniae]MBJ9902509.1 TIGR03862 family flavoprotein [Acinetobacter bereziniae]MCU4318759.1 TIGR03862 family flavoprotein [Acinetobacter bereziniae]MCU4416512.1 TIGR03862 family flavoprotein [Acinetobacter bereziniae]
MSIKRVAIVGAGPAGLMAADVLSQYKNYEIHVFEQKPSAARKFLMAGKTGLNISHAETFEQFIQRYDQVEWLRPWIEKWDAAWIQKWMQSLGIESYVGSSGRIFPVEMKAAPLLRAWLKHLVEQQVKFHYRHQVTDLKHQQLKMIDLKSNQINEQKFDAIILACGAVSWSRLGSDGAWQKWLSSSEIETFQPSNAGVAYLWSDYMQSVFGQPLKRVDAWVEPSVKTQGDIVITHYGLESGLIYKQGRSLRQLIQQSQPLVMYLDLLPDQSIQQLVQKLQPSKKQSTANIWRKAGLDTAKSSLLRELVDKALWNDPEQLAQQIKHLKIELQGFRPIEEAISCAGGVKEQALTQDLQLKSHLSVFCCGEMLDWDAPTGGYLLTACFATGRAAGEGVHQYLSDLL